MDWQLGGALGFGLLIGWYVYYVNRYRKGDVQFSDIVTLIGAIGGAAVLKLFDADTDLFGAYGIGLAIGFFGYFLCLLLFVAISSNFDVDWFLDGRRKSPGADYGYGTDTRQTVTPMALNPTPPNATINYYGSNPGDVAAMARSFGGDVERAFATPNPDVEKIRQACVAVWSASGPAGPFKDACNFYVIEVCHRLGITVSGTAEQIIANLKAQGWSELPMGDGVAARTAAEQGKLVIAGVPSAAYNPPEEAHVAIVVTGSMNPGGWAPAGFWGSTNETIRDKGGSGAPISVCFRAGVKGKIQYFSHDT